MQQSKAFCSLINEVNFLLYVENVYKVNKQLCHIPFSISTFKKVWINVQWSMIFFHKKN